MQRQQNWLSVTVTVTIHGGFASCSLKATLEVPPSHHTSCPWLSRALGGLPWPGAGLHLHISASAALFLEPRTPPTGHQEPGELLSKVCATHHMQWLLSWVLTRTHATQESSLRVLPEIVKSKKASELLPMTTRERSHVVEKHRVWAEETGSVYWPTPVLAASLP